jgi:hypothetical protein
MTYARSQIASDRWLIAVRGTESRYYSAIDSAEALMAEAAELGQAAI